MTSPPGPGFPSRPGAHPHPISAHRMDDSKDDPPSCSTAPHSARLHCSLGEFETGMMLADLHTNKSTVLRLHARKLGPDRMAREKVNVAINAQLTIPQVSGFCHLDKRLTGIRSWLIPGR
ncbi:hypothetical protein N656DRAFT_631889 [Canariomyces notabilis]|uniref:Uncharacterized protein n=1 Tax=Canariomyces notabilis TaxID=2074819 RepID=A0AAN6TFS9_9PEZI|nr:hypothetical protein N656DRAFT_631889 [Canariomyces arenarius]